MIKVENKYNIDDNVFYFFNGSIWHCHITQINIRIKQKEEKLSYTIVPYNGLLFSYMIVSEDEITANIEDIINVIPIK